MARIEIRGKRGRIVPVILTPELSKAVEHMNAKQNEVGVSEDNDFVFARPLSANPLRASECLHQLAVQCGAKNPAHLTSTHLRKHIATSQILNLPEYELDILAGFLGHDLHIHRNFYRLPQDTLQLAKVSKVLLAYDKGNISDYKGKSLDEIQIDNEAVCSEDSGDSDKNDNEDVDQPSQNPKSKRPRKQLRARQEFCADTDEPRQQQPDSESEDGDQPSQRTRSKRPRKQLRADTDVESGKESDSDLPKRPKKGM